MCRSGKGGLLFGAFTSHAAWGRIGDMATSSFTAFLARFYPVTPPTPMVLVALGALTLFLGMMSGVLLVIGLAIFIWAVIVYADPSRPIPEGQGLILAPIDGRLVEVASNVGLPLSFDQAKDQQEHFLRLDLVHEVASARTLRAPSAGTIREILRWTPDASEQADGQEWKHMDGVAILIEIAPDQECALVLQSPIFPKQIHLTCKVGDQVNSGDRLGVVLLHARVSLYILQIAPLLRTIDQHVYAGETVLQAASFRQTPMFRTV